MMIIVAVLAMAYAIGSIPTGYVMGRVIKGIDIRGVGSGNVGATNVFRTVGRAAGVATLLIDAAKGYGAVHIALRIAGGEAVPLLAGLASVVGHSWSAWVGFRGGKGVATAAGVFLALMPGPTAAALGVFVVVFFISRRVSAGSIVAAVALPVAARVWEAGPWRVACSAVVAALVVLRHAPNIRRLLRGEEPPLILARKRS